MPKGKLSEMQSAFLMKSVNLFLKQFVLDSQYYACDIVCPLETQDFKAIHQCWTPLKMLTWIFVTCAYCTHCSILTHSSLLVVNPMMFSYVTEIR